MIVSLLVRRGLRRRCTGSWSSSQANRLRPDRSGRAMAELAQQFVNGGPQRMDTIILPVLEAWRGLRARAAELSRQIVASARGSEQCQLLSSIPGIGAVTASSFVAAIEDPANFRKSRSVGAWIGLTTREQAAFTRNAQPGRTLLVKRCGCGLGIAITSTSMSVGSSRASAS